MVHGLLIRTIIVEVAYNGTLNAVYKHEENDVALTVFFSFNRQHSVNVNVTLDYPYHRWTIRSLPFYIIHSLPWTIRTVNRHLPFDRMGNIAIQSADPETLD